MRTVDPKTNLNTGWWVKLKSDMSLAARLARMTIFYWTTGRKLRASYRRMEQRGEIFYVDDDPTETERRLR